MWLYKKLFDLKDENVKNNGSVDYWIKDGKIFIDACTAAQADHSTSNYYLCG